MKSITLKAALAIVADPLSPEYDQIIGHYENHAVTVLPEVVAALEEVLNTLSPHLDKRARATLTKANTVKIP